MEEVSVLEGNEAKSLHKKKLVKAKNIIADSIKDQLSSLNTPKNMFDSLTKIFEGKNINWKVTLRNKLKNVKIQNAETIQSSLQGSLKSKNKYMIIWR